MGVNHKKMHGPLLVEAGYMLVPIKTGEKSPNKKGWPQLRATLDDVKSWIPTRYYGGLGVLGKFTPGIDIDVYDKKLVDKIIEWCRDNIGRTPIRTGNAPRVLIPCAAPENGLGPDSSNKYEDELGDTHQLEIKATGQQWVAYGVHPTTKNPYTWEGGDLYSVRSEELPVLTPEKIKSLFEYFESIVPDNWTIAAKGRRRKPMGGMTKDGYPEGIAAFANYKPPINIDTDRIKSMLAHISPDGGHDTWLMVGMALYHQFKGDEEGKEIFVKWSENSIDFDEEEIDLRWPSWEARSYGGEAVTLATVIQMYNESVHETTDPTLLKKSKNLSEWEKRFVMVDLADSSDVHDAGVPIYKAHRHTLKAFKEQNACYMHKRIDPNGDTVTEPMVASWQNSKNVRHLAGYTYQPGASRFCTRPNDYGDDTQYVNTFYFPPHDTGIENVEEKIKVFMNLINHLFPIKADRDWFVQWLARLIQNPSVRSFVTPINITPVTGTGRGILFGILRLLVGGHNTHDVSPDDMSGRFNGFLDKCIIAVVQEIKANTGTKKYQTWERMKSLLADTEANIQEKGKDSYTASVYANFLMFSNNVDAVPIQDVNERRIYAMQGAYHPLSNKEIDNLMAWKKSKENIAALFNYLKKVEVNHTLFKRAPKSKLKVQMVHACIGVGGADLNTWLKEKAPRVFDFNYAMTELENYSEDIGVVGMARDKFRRTLLDKGYHNQQIRVGKDRVYVYYHPQHTKDDVDTLRKLLNFKEEDILS